MEERASMVERCINVRIYNGACSFTYWIMSCSGKEIPTNLRYVRPVLRITVCIISGVIHGRSVSLEIISHCPPECSEGGPMSPECFLENEWFWYQAATVRRTLPTHDSHPSSMLIDLELSSATCRCRHETCWENKLADAFCEEFNWNAAADCVCFEVEWRCPHLVPK